MLLVADPSAAVRTARIIRIDRPVGSWCAMATKLYCPPTPETTRPSSNPSEATAPLSVASIPELMKRAPRRCALNSRGFRSSWLILSTPVMQIVSRSSWVMSRSPW